MRRLRGIDDEGRGLYGRSIDGWRDETTLGQLLREREVVYDLFNSSDLLSEGESLDESKLTLDELDEHFAFRALKLIEEFLYRSVSNFLTMGGL